MSKNNNVVYSINGPVVTVKNTKDFLMLEMVHVGNKKLIGEVIAINEEFTTIQVYETTTGLKPGEPVVGTGDNMCVLLGPGIISNIFDGIERPLKKIASESGVFISEGCNVDYLDMDKLWDIKVTAKLGEVIKPGYCYATCQETPLIEHRCLLSPNSKEGEVIFVAEDGKYTLNDVVVKLKTNDGEIIELKLYQKWPIRVPRPVSKRLPLTKPLITGQRVIDSMFPIAKGGTGAIPGGFGTGKTMTQHQLAKWCDADIIVYIGCGERGNEMTQVLEEFSELIDPKSGSPLTDRTVLIANTSNMPVAAREASIYTGITLAEYYRDMGYHVAMMADSTSRWAEALREISGRLEEMPAEEGYPAYLPSRLSQFYERAGYMMNLNGEEGSISIIGAVSPQGADFSEPVTQNTKRFVRCFWALDKNLAYSRHYPAINWNNSYSEYLDDITDWYHQNIDSNFFKIRQKIYSLLQQESKLIEIAQLVGADVLPDDQKLILEMAKVIKVGFLQQNAYHKDDTYVPLTKQLKMMDVIIKLYEVAKLLISSGTPLSQLMETTDIFEKLIKMKYEIPNDRLEMFDMYVKEIEQLKQ